MVTTEERQAACSITKQQVAHETYQCIQAHKLARQRAAKTEALRLAREAACWRRYHDVLETCA